MLQNHKVVVTIPVYNSAATLLRTYKEVAEQEIVDAIVIVDDCSDDNTHEVLEVLEKAYICQHPLNLGYGGNQKTCYRVALELGADVVIMVHPDYQYTPKLIPAIAGMIVSGVYDCVLGSRIVGGGALKGGMPFWRYIGNRFLTMTENIFVGTDLSEYHTGYRGFSRQLLEQIDTSHNSDGFLFDNQILTQIAWHNYKIGEVSCPTSYHSDASSIGFWLCVPYGFGCLATAIKYRLARMGFLSSRLYPRESDA